MEPKRTIVVSLENLFQWGDSSLEGAIYKHLQRTLCPKELLELRGWESLKVVLSFKLYKQGSGSLPPGAIIGLLESVQRLQREGLEITICS